MTRTVKLVNYIHQRERQGSYYAQTVQSQFLVFNAAIFKKMLVCIIATGPFQKP